LIDPNGQQIETKTFRSNEFGSFSGSFTAPRDRGTGYMRLRILGRGGGQANFRVEEYKRPKFFVEVEKPTEQTRLEQPVNVNVKATGYTGAPVDNAKVTATLVLPLTTPKSLGESSAVFAIHSGGTGVAGTHHHKATRRKSPMAKAPHRSRVTSKSNSQPNPT